MAAALAHFLSPLSVSEMQNAVRILKQHAPVPRASWRFITTQMHEPPAKMAFVNGATIPRQAFMVLLNVNDGGCYEAIVDLKEEKVVSCARIANAHPAVTPDEYEMCEKIVKADSRFQAAMAKRGVTDMNLVMVDMWTVGCNYKGEESDDKLGKRLTKPLVFVRLNPTDNGYAHPVEGLTPVVDLLHYQVLRIEDTKVIPIPQGDFPLYEKPYRTDLKPLKVVQPEGASFTLDGHHVQWQKWDFHVGFNAREGLTLHAVGYNDNGRLRPVLARASLAEMVVPYGEPTAPHYRKNAFDVGEEGIGFNMNSLNAGCDCLGTAAFLDAHVNNSHGDVVTIKNAVCIHEEDAGILWKHTDWRNAKAELRRARRLVVSVFCTVANYDYGFYWYFTLDGAIKFEAKMSGIINSIGLADNNPGKFATLVAPNVSGPIHQHFFNIRLDFAVDGVRNSLYEVNTQPYVGSANRQGNAFYAEATQLKTENEAQRHIDTQKVNKEQRNSLNEPVSYALIPSENTFTFATPESSLVRRAPFIKYHLWATPASHSERFPAGNYPNQHPGGDGLSAWSQANRSLDQCHLVVWYTMGALHVVRPEDFPVMSVVPLTFTLRPEGFFSYNPSLDVPPPPCEHKAKL